MGTPTAALLAMSSGGPIDEKRVEPCPGGGSGRSPEGRIRDGFKPAGMCYTGRMKHAGGRGRARLRDTDTCREPLGRTIRTTGVVLPVVLTLQVQAAVSAGVVALAVLMPAATHELGVPSSSVGIFMSAVYLGSLVVAPVSGHFVDRFGSIRISQACVLLCAVGLWAVSLPFIPLMAVGAFVLGAGHGPATPASSHLLARTTPATMRSLVFSIKQTGVPIGGTLAGAVVPYLVVSCGWKISALWVAAAITTLAIALQFFRNRYDADLSAVERFSWSKIVEPIRMNLRHPDLRRISVASLFFSLMQLSLVSFLVTYLIERLGMTLIQAGFLLSTTQAGGFIGRIAWGACADRCVRPSLVLGSLGLGMTAAAVALACLTPQWPFWAIFFTALVFGSTAIGWNGVYLAEIARLAEPRFAGIATGGSVFFNFLGILLGLPVFSLVVETTGSYPLAFGMVAVTTLLCGLALLAAGRRGDARHR